MNKLHVTLFIALSLLLFSCFKKTDCGTEYILNAPAVVNEGETLELNVDNYEGASNTYFYWKVPDMTPYTNFVGDRTPDDENFVIENFSIKDVGEYSVEVSINDEGCQTFILDQTIEMTPKTCDCPEPPEVNKIYYDASYESQFTEDALSITYFDSQDNSPSQINFNGVNDFTVYFGKKLPEHSSTFNIIGGHNYFWDSVDDGDLDVHFHLWGHNHGLEYFDIEENKSMYLTRQGNQLTMQFCDLQVFHLGSPVFKMSAKLVVDL